MSCRETTSIAAVDSLAGLDKRPVAVLADSVLAAVAAVAAEAVAAEAVAAEAVAVVAVAVVALAKAAAESLPRAGRRAAAAGLGEHLLGRPGSPVAPPARCSPPNPPAWRRPPLPRRKALAGESGLGDWGSFAGGSR